MLSDRASMVLDTATVTALLNVSALLLSGMPPLLSSDSVPPSRVMARLLSGLVDPVVVLPSATALPA